MSARASSRVSGVGDARAGRSGPGRPRPGRRAGSGRRPGGRSPRPCPRSRARTSPGRVRIRFTTTRTGAPARRSRRSTSAAGQPGRARRGPRCRPRRTSSATSSAPRVSWLRPGRVPRSPAGSSSRLNPVSTTTCPLAAATSRRCSTTPVADLDPALGPREPGDDGEPVVDAALHRREPRLEGAVGGQPGRAQQPGDLVEDAEVLGDGRRRRGRRRPESCATALREQASQADRHGRATGGAGRTPHRPPPDLGPTGGPARRLGIVERLEARRRAVRLGLQRVGQPVEVVVAEEDVDPDPRRPQAGRPRSRVRRRRRAPGAGGGRRPRSGRGRERRGRRPRRRPGRRCWSASSSSTSTQRLSTTIPGRAPISSSTGDSHAAPAATTRTTIIGSAPADHGQGRAVGGGEQPEEALGLSRGHARAPACACRRSRTPGRPEERRARSRRTAPVARRRPGEAWQPVCAAGRT